MKLNALLTSALMISPLIANDNFADSEAVNYSGSTLTYTSTTNDATREPDEPLHGAPDPQFSGPVASRWYSVTVDQPYRIEALVDYEGLTSGLDALIAVYTGESLPGLVNISRYADIDFPATSTRLQEPFGAFARVNFDAVPGITYHIAIDGEGNKGPYRLVLKPSRDPHAPTAEMVAPGSNWRSLIARDGTNQPVDPIVVDAEFFDKWHLSANLDSLGFTSPLPAPIGYYNAQSPVDAYASTKKPIKTGLWETGNPVSQPPGGSRYTSYHRITFTPGSQIDGLGFEGLFDDGAIFYVNGEEVARTNVNPDDDALNWQTTALGTELPGGAGSTESVMQYASAPDLVLPGGVPVEFAVSLHNQSGGSSDIAFDMRVWALGGDGVVVPYVPPFVATIAPAATAGRYDISWPSKDGETYQIQSSTTLEDDDWTDVFLTDIDPSGTGTNTTNVPGNGDKVFYRVIKR